MRLDVSIRELNTLDKTEWLNLWHRYLQFYQSELAQEVTENTWTKLIAPERSHIYGFVAILNQEIVGIVHVIEHESCWTIQPYAYLQDLFVLEEFRAKGIARQLIEHVAIYTKQRHCDRVYWLTHKDNEIAQQLYDRVACKTGFIQYRM